MSTRETTSASELLAQKIKRLEDEREIEALMHVYAEMVDRREWKKMDRVFALEATIDYTSTGGQKGPFRETLAWLDRALESWPLNLHIITNLIIEIDGDTARTRCYFHAPMGRNQPSGEQLIITNAGRYLDKLVRTADGWRITERFCDQTIMQGSLPEGYVIPT